MFQTNQNNLQAQFDQFKKTINGNPEDMVKELLSSGRMTQEQFQNSALELSRRLNMEYDRMKKVQSQIEDELNGACEYIKCALELKDTDRAWADTYYQMAQQEYLHMTNLHTMAVNEIRRLAEEGDESYKTMKAVYDYLHEKVTEKAASVQAMMNMYKG